MTVHSSILAWEISWTEEPGGLQLMGSQRGEHNLAIKQQQQIYIYIYTHIYIFLTYIYIYIFSYIYIHTYSYIYVYICSNNRYIYSYTYILLQTLFHSKLLQDIKYNSLCYAVDPCLLFHM